jgi:uncharacterized protein (DUF169 family)
MPGTDWKACSETIRRLTSLAVSPVAVTLLPESKRLLDLPTVRLLHQTAPCQMAALARYYREDGVVGASSEGIKCVWGSSCLGIIRTPERLAEGQVMRQFTSGLGAGKELQSAVGALGNNGKPNDAVVMAPLDLTPLDPDVVVLYLTPAQALRIIIAYTYEKGEKIESSITGQASLCSSIAHAIDERGLVVDIPCIGDRTYGLVQEQEMIVAFHADRTAQICEGLKATDGWASFPFRPFLRWPVILPPDMEPRRPELE